MPSISQIVNATEDATINVKGLEIGVTYRPNAMTMQRMTELQKRAANEDISAVADIITDMLVSWDVEGPLVTEDGTELAGEGEVIPVTAQTITALPAFFVLELSRTMQEVVTEGQNPTAATPRSRKR